MDISLIIPTHQRTKGIMTLLRSIELQQTENLQVEVIVVSNLFDAGLQNSILNFRNKSSIVLRYYFSGVIGVNCARNLGLNHSKSDHILFLDDDVVLQDPHYLKTILDHALMQPQAGAIGGRYQLPDKVNPSDRAYFTISDSWLTHGLGEANQAVHLVGGNTLYNKKVLGHRLKFNENITFGGAETELNLRLFQAGHALMLFPDIALVHVTQLTPLSLFRKAFYQGMGRAYHEQVVSPELWKTKQFGSSPEHKISHAGSWWELLCEKYLIAWFSFFFRIGYRHAKTTNLKKPNFYYVTKSLLLETFSVSSQNEIFFYNPDAKPYHESVYPNFRLREMYHWFRAKNPSWRVSWFFQHRVFVYTWRIPWLLKHKILAHSWRVKWMLKYKIIAVIWNVFVSLWLAFAKCWYLLYALIGKVRAQIWKIPWFIKTKILSKTWLISWFLKYKIWEKLYWFIKYKIVLSIKHLVVSIFLFLRHKIVPHLWRIPWFIRFRILNHLWSIPWFVKWRIIPLFVCFLIFPIYLLFPFNLVGLGVIYALAWDELENFVKKPWANS